MGNAKINLSNMKVKVELSTNIFIQSSPLWKSHWGDFVWAMFPFFSCHLDKCNCIHMKDAKLIDDIEVGFWEVQSIIDQPIKTLFHHRNHHHNLRMKILLEQPGWLSGLLLPFYSSFFQRALLSTLPSINHNHHHHSSSPSSSSSSPSTSLALSSSVSSCNHQPCDYDF